MNRGELTLYRESLRPSFISHSRNRKPLNFLRRSQQAVPHQKLGGRYKVINQLGVGGFSQTFLAQDLHLPGHPLCVVKQFKPQVADPVQLQTASRLFDTEAKVLYQLGEHPQIPRLLAHFEEEQEFYLVQEFIEGQPLAKLLRGRPWSERRVIALLQDLLQILVFVHRQSVIHRDIKPSNLIYRNPDGRIVLIDFGAVKQVSTQLTESSTGLFTVSIGTQGYMPMEQLSGSPRFSSDIYAAGVVCIQALTGLSPRRFKSDLQTGEIVWRDLHPSAQVGQSPVNPVFAAILDRMVCYHFKDRYQTAEEALTALEALLIEYPDLTEPETPLDTTEPASESVPLLSEAPLPPVEAESALSLPPVLVDEPTRSLTESDAPAPFPAPPLPASPITELVTDAPIAPIAPIDSPVEVGDAGDEITSSRTSDPATAPADVEPMIESLEQQQEPSENGSEPSVFPTALTPDLPAELPNPMSIDAAVSPALISLPVPMADSAGAVPALADEPISLEADHPLVASPQPVAAEPVSEMVPTTHVAPVARLDEPPSPWQRSRFLPWKLLLGVGLAVGVAVPFFSQFLRPQVQSGINPASLANLPCREPAPPPLPSGEADYEYPDGTRYYGAVRQGLPTDGKATMVFPSGNRYDGEFQNGQRNGCGTLTFTNGRSYMGQFKDDQFNGQGVWTLETGDRYVGSFLNNRCHGEGTFFFANGDTEQGRWQNGKLIDGDLQCDQ
jgi:serine/threonine protein kinase